MLLRSIFVFIDYSKYKEDKGNYDVFILNNTKVKENMHSYNVLLKNNNKYKDKFVLNLFVKGKSEIYKYGDILKVQGTLQIPKTLGNKGEFNYKKYLNSKKIYGVINGYNFTKIDHKIGNIIYNISYKIRDFFNKNIDKSLTYKEANLLKSMLYGDTRFLDEDLNEIFENIGITHLLAVSGSNVATVVIISKMILDKMKLSKNFINYFLIIIVIIFTIISGCELSIVRASIMCIIMILGDILGRKYTIWSSIYTSFYLMLLYNPYCILNVGMQLSFLATIGIVMFYKHIITFFKNNILSRLKNEILIHIFEISLDMLAVTISAFVMILPVQLYYFNSFNIIIFVSNIIAVFLADIICNIGFVSLFVSFIPLVNFFSTNCILVLLKCLINISNLLGNFKFLELKVKSPNIVIISMYYILVILIFKYINNKRYLKKVILKICKIYILILIVTSVYNIFLDNYVIFFNVGQGDCSLIKVFSKIIVVDCGSTEKKAGKILNSYLKQNGIEKIDILILSHSHEDHINGIKDLEDVKIKNIVYTREDVIPFIGENIPRIQVIKDEIIKINNNCFIEIKSPSIDNIKDNDEKNANSLVALIKLNKNKILYMGDSTQNTEQILIKNNIEKVDVLKVGHHGSKTSTSYKFINKIRPLYAVISSKKEEYGHPDKEVLEILSKFNIKVHITEKDKFLKFKLSLFI